MADDLTVIQGTREEQYEGLLQQITGLVTGESDLIANLANVSAALKLQFGWLWVGFYLVNKYELVLGPFQGPIACTRIPFHKGVCGACYTQRKTIIVPDVDQFPGHIACSSASKSEVVVPVFNRNGTVAMVLDVDSDQLDDFTQADAEGLEKIVKLLEGKI